MEESIAKLLLRQAGPETVTVKGWLRTKRVGKTMSFLEVNDGSCLKGIQVVVNNETFADLQVLDSLTTGCSLICRGKIVDSVGGNQAVELAAESIELVGACPADTYPLQKKRHTLEYLREIGHLRARTNTIGAAARVRNTMAYAVHSFFQEHGFCYVNTPLITASDAEGAGAMFQVTTLDIGNPPRTEDGAVDYSKDFFGRPTLLTVSGQLEGETYAMALKNIYTFGPTFRAENSLTKRHLAEFWMIEPEMAFCNLDGDRAWVEAFLKYIFRAVLRDRMEDLEFFDKFTEPGLIEKLRKVVETPFAHLTYTEAVSELEKAKVDFEFKPYWGCDLQTEHERYLSETVCGGPVAVTDYPEEIKAFYMKQNDDGKTVAAMDVMVPRLGEIVGGSEREYRYDVLLTKMQKLGLKPEDYWWYLDLRRFGSVPHAGFGLGFERAVMYATGIQNIRDVIPYPRAAGSAEF